MGIFEALLYGAVQGVTEYLPVSSSAHLILLPRFLGTQEQGLAFDVFLHLGTLGATLLYFRRDWLMIAQAAGALIRGKRTHSPVSGAAAGADLLGFLIFATIPALLVGALVHEWVETALRSNTILIFTLGFGGLLLYFVDRWSKSSLPIERLTWKRALGVGIAQCFALVPGMSRSGSTMIGGRLVGLDRAGAARFSFLMSAPVTGAAIVFELRKFGELIDGPVGLPALIAAGLGSFVFGWLAIDGLLKLVRRFGFLSFAIYRVLLAGVVYWTLGAG